MTKAVLFSGTHPRHLFINKEVLKYFDDVLVVVMEREELLPDPPLDLVTRDKNLFMRHFENRLLVEQKAYGSTTDKEVFKNHQVYYTNPKTLNSKDLADKISAFDAEFAFIFGVNLIVEPVIDVLPKDKINLHLGLSPWYKGGATLYWPFYHLEPQFCGATFHQIIKAADAGEIIHQCVPKLEFGDTIHDVGVKTVLEAVIDLKFIMKHWLKKRNFAGKLQKISGRNWRGIDFQPSQLRVIYELFDDNIVDKYLLGELGSRVPKLFSCIEKTK